MENRRFAIWLTGIVCMALAGLFLSMLLPIRGEEGVYVKQNLEMLHSGDWMHVKEYGNPYWRAPMYNWAGLLVSRLTGWREMLLANRAVSVASTMLMALAVFSWARYCWKDRASPLLAAALFLSGDVLFKRGWVAYSDPLFALFVVLAVLFLWFAAEAKRPQLFAVSGLFLVASLLAKTFTGYVFYAGAYAALLLTCEPCRKTLLGPASLILHAGCVLAGFLVMKVFIPSGNSPGIELVQFDIAARSGAYLADLVMEPVTLGAKWIPLSLLLGGWWIVGRRDVSLRGAGRFLLVMVLLNSIPYWLAPGVSAARYYLPLLPFIALLAAFVLRQIRHRLLAPSVVVLLLTAVGAKAAFLIRPQWIDRVSYAYPQTAQSILEEVGDHPLYAAALEGRLDPNIGAWIDLKGLPGRPPLAWAPEDATECYILAPYPDTRAGTVVKDYRLTLLHRFTLHYRGATCDD